MPESMAEGQPVRAFQPMLIEKIAQVCHEANRGICQSAGDNSQLPWLEAAGWQRESARAGVRFALANPQATPADQHEAWVKDKAINGWKFGPVKDFEKLEHPCMVPYDQLPEIQRAKDHVFRAIVSAMIDDEAC